MPKPVAFKMWWLRFKNIMLEYTKDPDALLVWLGKMETLSEDEVENTGQFPLMDKYLLQGLEEIFGKTLMSQVNIKKTYCAQRRKNFRGRQAGRMLWHSMSMSQSNANRMQLDALENQHLQGENLPVFLDEWDLCCMNFGGNLPCPSYMEELLREQLDKSKNFHMTMQFYYHETILLGKPYNLQILYDKARMFVKQTELHKIMRPIPKTEGHARSSISAYPICNESILKGTLQADGHVRQMLQRTPMPI